MNRVDESEGNGREFERERDDIKKANGKWQIKGRRGERWGGGARREKSHYGYKTKRKERC